jgi:hypothetical protein
MTIQREISLNEEVDRFIFKWDQIIVDYWWRKRYNIPFGSSAHREMNFIDMLIEYREHLNRIKGNKEENVIDINEDNVVRMSNEEIDKDYENLDLSKF